MKILLTGTTGYIGKILLPVLLADGHEVICCTHDKKRFSADRINSPYMKVITAGFLDKSSLTSVPEDIDAAYS
jgi:uncharacterized protein YbjT (DUF2867 family)